MSDDLLVFRNFGIALFIGALVGAEREKRKDRDVGGFGGLRTFILIALAGAMSAFLAATLQTPWFFAAGLLSFGLLVGAAHHAEVTIDRDAAGATTEIAALVTFLLGGAAVSGHANLAVAAGIATSAVLALKRPLHEAVGRIDLDDFVAGLKLLFATFIVLPLLPNETLDPWGALNPYKLWLLVVLISTLSLAGYVAVRMLGPSRGTAVTGMAGGLVSSTAVTLSFARRSKMETGGEGALTVGVLLSWTVMFVRVLVMLAVVSPSMIPTVEPPMAVLGGVTALTAAATVRLTAKEESQAPAHVKVKNPFSLVSATKFGLFFAVVLLLVAIARQQLTDRALMLVSAIAGTTDVDAIALTLARLVPTEIDPAFAARGVVIATLSNTVVKAGMVAVLGSRTFAKRILAATAVLVVAAVATLLVM